MKLIVDKMSTANNFQLQVTEIYYIQSKKLVEIILPHE